MRIITAQEWGRELDGQLTPMAVPANYWIIHHSAGPADRPIMDEARIINADSIAEGKVAIDYSFLINQSGIVIEGRGFGYRGAHTGATVPAGQPRAGESYNNAGHAVCFVGNYHPPFAPVPSVHPTPEQLEGCARLIAESVRVGVCVPDWITLGHRDAKATACPGDNLYPHVVDIHMRARAILETKAELEMHLSDKDLDEIRKILRESLEAHAGDCGIGEDGKPIRRTVRNAVVAGVRSSLKAKFLRP